MANKLYEETHIQSIADGIRRKNKLSNTMILSEMPFAISEADTSPYGKLPSYWKNSVDNAISTIKKIVEGDNNYIPLAAYFSDMHVSYKYSPNQGYTGILSAMVMNATQMPFALCTGDISASSGNGFNNEKEMVYCFEDVNDILSPIGWNRLLVTQGNHDGSWGTVNDKAYAYQMSPGKLYEYIYRKLDTSNHIFGGGDNSYYYVDYTEKKIRVIMLNSLWCETSENSDGTAVYDRQHYFGFGQAQLSWLANTALNLEEEGWIVLLATHVPPIDKYKSNFRDMTILHGILNAFCNKEAYTGNYTHNSNKNEGTWADVSISVDFSNKTTGVIAGFFCGHVHKDTIDTNTYKYPIITVTCDADIPYDETEEDRVKGTDNEQAIDFITINIVKQEVILTRLGVGTSRVYSYDGTIIYAITNNLTNVTINNSIASIERGLSFTATLTVKEDCELETLTITMGGIDITDSVYSNGVINILEVTGNIVITAKAKTVPKPITYVNKMVVQESNLNRRISGTTIAGTTSDATGCFICDKIEVDLTQECPVIFKNFASNMGTIGSGGSYGNSKVALLDSDGNCLAVWYIAASIPASSGNHNHWLCAISGNDCVGDLSTIFDTIPAAGTMPSSSDVKYVIFAPQISKSTITMDSLSGLEIQMIGEDDGSSVPTYTITRNLTGCTSNETNTTITSGTSLSETLIVNAGYESLESVVVIMDGVDITSTAVTGDMIVIGKVTGNVVITAIAKEIQQEGTYTNLADPTSTDWVNDSRLSSSGSDKGEGGFPGGVVTNWIECKRGDVIRIKGINLTSKTVASNTTAPYISVEYTSGSISTTDINSYEGGFVESDGITTFNVLCLSDPATQGIISNGEVAKIRLSGLLTADSVEDVIITKNEVIS